MVRKIFSVISKIPLFLLLLMLSYLPLVSCEAIYKNHLIHLSNDNSITKLSETSSGKDVILGEPKPSNLVSIPVAAPPSFESVSGRLDSVKFETIARLEFAKGDTPFFGNISWSPDNTRFVGEYAALVEGRQIEQLYIGDVQTGKVSLWRENASFPVWGRDNNSILYLRLRVDEPPLVIENGWSRSHYDLMSGSVDSGGYEMLLKDVIPPYFPLPQHGQTTQGYLLTLDNKHRLVVLPSPSKLVELTKQGVQPSPVVDLSEIVGISQHAELPMFDETDPSFSMSPDGSKAIVYRATQPAYLVNVGEGKVEGQIEGIDTPHNIAWSTDGKLVPYTNSQGVFVYDVNTKITSHLLAGNTLGFAKETARSGFSSPAWAFDNHVLLFMVSSSDWVKPGTEDKLGSYTMAATRDGKSWKLISDSDLISVSSTGIYAILRSRSDSKTTVFELAKILK